MTTTMLALLGLAAWLILIGVRAFYGRRAAKALAEWYGKHHDLRI